jgi:hypothetical protein
MIHVHRTATLCRLATFLLLPLAALLPLGAHAQLSGDLLKGASGGGGGPGNVGNLLQGPTGGTTNISNIAGVLQFCIKKKYLGGGSTSSVESSLMGKLPDKSPKTNSSYTDGLKGILHSDNGSDINLDRSGLGAAATRQICDTVLSTAKSML